MKKLNAILFTLLLSWVALADDWQNLEDEKHLRDLFINYSDLVDPFSVQFRLTKFRTGIAVNGKEYKTWCGQSNQKNKMGGYTGWVFFYAHEGLQDGPKINIMMGDNVNIMMIGAKSFCKDSGLDGF